jgi:hypothetical protein
LYKFGVGFFPSGKAEEAQIAPLSKLTTTLASLTPPLTAFAALSVLPTEAKLRGKKATQHDGKKTSEMYKLFFDSD